MDPAPSELLSNISCQCKGNCSALRCGCFKNQVKCTSACGVCCGTDCLNTYVPDDIEADEYSKNFQFGLKIVWYLCIEYNLKKKLAFVLLYPYLIIFAAGNTFYWFTQVRWWRKISHKKNKR